MADKMVFLVHLSLQGCFEAYSTEHVRKDRLGRTWLKGCVDIQAPFIYKCSMEVNIFCGEMLEPYPGLVQEITLVQEWSLMILWELWSSRNGTWADLIQGKHLISCTISSAWNSWCHEDFSSGAIRSLSKDRQDGECGGYCQHPLLPWTSHSLLTEPRDNSSTLLGVLFCVLPLKRNISLIAFANHVLFLSPRIIHTEETLPYVKVDLIIWLGGGWLERLELSEFQPEHI